MGCKFFWFRPSNLKKTLKNSHFCKNFHVPGPNTKWFFPPELLFVWVYFWLVSNYRVVFALFQLYFTWRGLQLPFQNVMATFFSLKIVAAMTKIARVPFTMQKLVFCKKCCRAPPGELQNFFITKNVIPQWVTPNSNEKLCTFFFTNKI